MKAAALSKTRSASGARSAATRVERASTGYLITNAARVSAYYLRDAARGRPVARQLRDIPTSPRELSAEWLTAAALFARSWISAAEHRPDRASLAHWPQVP